jgi:hypothetical protein
LNKSLSVVISSLLMLIGTLSFLTGPMILAQAQDPHVGHKLLQDATLSIDPSGAEVDVGDTTTVDITIDDVTDLAYLEIYVLFDPTLLEVVDADSETSGVQVEIGPFLGTDVIVEDNEVDENDGEIYFTQQVFSDTVDGSGVLATITFQGVTSGTSDITIDDIGLYLEDSEGDPVDVDAIENGTITVTADVTSTPTPEETSTPTRTPAETSTPTRTPASTATSAPTDTPAPTSEPTARPTATSEIKTRVLQIWPDRSVGVSSGLIEGKTSYAGTQAFPFGVLNPSTDETVEARTYLHFPIDVFPLGTQVKRATLYVYVDSASSLEEAAFGTYRVLDPWSTTGWSEKPASWPDLLPAPIAITEVDLAEEAALPVSSLKLARVLSQDSPLPTPTPGSSVLPTPTSRPTSTATATPQPTSAVTSQATSSPRPTSTVRPSSTPKPGSSPPPIYAPTFELEAIDGRWVTWDVTALLRAWLAKEIPDHGLALAAVEDPDSGSMDDLILARSLTVKDPDTMPYIIADIEIHPVTPTPAPILPVAGDSGEGNGIGVMIVGATLLILGLALAAWRGRFTDHA